MAAPKHLVPLWLSAPANFGFIALLWLDFVIIFSREWSFSEQYSYGFLVPFLTAYLIYLRFSPPPAQDHSAGYGAWIQVAMVALVFLLPVRLILAANPEWRLALWLYALVIYVVTMQVFGSWGGRDWMRAAAAAFALMLFSVPWPTVLEQPLVQAMSTAVAVSVASIASFFGHYAERQGTIIELMNGFVGVEDACSGIRSLQSSLMGAYFIGEVLRWSVKRRIGFILFACAFAFALNIFRTLILTWAMIQSGPEGAAEIHDSLGQGFNFLGLIVLIGAGFLVNLILPKLGRPNPGPREIEERYAIAWPRRRLAYLIGIFIAGHIITYAWFARGESVGESDIVTFDWQALGVNPVYLEIAPAVREQLRFSDGYQVQWAGHRGALVMAFAFRWQQGTISSFAGVHRPETCLPSAGFVLRDRRAGPTVRIGDRMVDFDAYVFENPVRRIYVFFAVWDEVPGRSIPVARDWKERVGNALRGLRVENRHSLQVVIGEVNDIQEAEMIFRELALESRIGRGGP